MNFSAVSVTKQSTSSASVPKARQQSVRHAVRSTPFGTLTLGESVSSESLFRLSLSIYLYFSIFPVKFFFLVQNIISGSEVFRLRYNRNFFSITYIWSAWFTPRKGIFKRIIDFCLFWRARNIQTFADKCAQEEAVMARSSSLVKSLQKKLDKYSSDEFVSGLSSND